MKKILCRLTAYAVQQISATNFNTWEIKFPQDGTEWHMYLWNTKDLSNVSNTAEDNVGMFCQCKTSTLLFCITITIQYDWFSTEKRCISQWNISPQPGYSLATPEECQLTTPWQTCPKSLPGSTVRTRITDCLERLNSKMTFCVEQDVKKTLTSALVNYTSKSVSSFPHSTLNFNSLNDRAKPYSHNWESST